ncbi:MAG TPA: choice-of-anchor Q domain-containing protein [Bryobacteraceae bacterium]|nr:choice-of-anchor Q domain-containing protein [Bryobacteraceae bacterium]
MLLACAGAPAARASGVVTNCSDSGAGSFAAAVSGGGLVTFAVSCIGNEPHVIQASGLSITSDTTIDATGQQVVLDGGGGNNVLFVSSGVTLALNNITIQHGNNYSGGGAIVNRGGTLIVTNCTFIDNLGGPDLGGGAILSYGGSGSVIIANSTFVKNRTPSPGGAGGAIYNANGSTLIITNSTFSGNTAPPSEGTIYNSGGTVTLENTILTGNSGGNCAGGVTDGGYNLADDSSCRFTAAGSQNSVLNLNLGSLANNGGWTQTIAPGDSSPAVGVIPAGTNGCATTITTDQRGTARPGDVNGNCSIGAYESVSPVVTTITKCTDDSQLQSAVAASGRIVFACSGTISTSGLSISSDTTLDATGQQVVIDGQRSQVFTVSGGALVLNNLTIQNARPAINNDTGALIITNSTFSNNNSEQGGAINNNNGTLTIANGTFSKNIADSGGAINNSGTLTIANSTFIGNSAQSSSALGGAILNEATAIIANSTFSGNTANGEGGAIYNAGGALTVENSILAGSGSAENCAGGVTDGGYNLADDKSCGFTAAGSQNSVTNLNLGSLSYNGGPALTIPLNTGSAALGAIPFGSSGCGAISSIVNAIVLTDERGVFRPQLTGTTACDIGAVQSTQNQIPVTFNTNPANLAYTVGSASYTGPQTLTLPISTQSTIWAPSPPPSAGTEYVWQSWSDSPTQAHVITILPPASGTLTYTANFNTLYLLTTGVNPGTGTVSVSASAEGNNGYYPAGTQITLTANANSGYFFQGWNGPALTTNPLQFALTAPATETAYFSTYTNQTGSISLTEVTGLLYSALLANPGSPGSPGGGTAVFIVTNTGGSTINGPIQLVLTNSPAGVTGANSSGTFNGSPYWTASMAALLPGASALVTVQLNYAAATAVSTTPVIYSGSL